MKRKLALYAAVFAVMGIAQSASTFAQQDKWIQLGQGAVSRSSTSAFIRSDSGRGTVCSLRLQAQGSGLEIHEVTVHFGNGQTLHIVNQVTLTPNGPLSDSPNISLPGNRRTVKGIDIVYKLPGADSVIPSLNLWGNTLPGQTYCPK
jgi:hypothetical protein